MKKSLLTILCTLLSVFSWAQGTTAGDGSAEAYAVLTDNQDIISQDATGVTYGKTLTFYYDDQKSANNGMSVGPFIYNNGWEGREWDDYASQITTVVFDESFKNYTSLTSTTIWFFRLSSLTSIQGIENLNTSNVTEMNYMFYECSSLRELDLSHFDTSNVGDMRYMFYGCTNMTSFNLKNFNTSKVFEMGGMFRDCTNLSELDISSFDTQNVTDMQLMFSGCANLTTLDLSSFNTANVSSMFEMFSGCTNLNSIYVSDTWSTARITSLEVGHDMFTGCTSLVGGAGTTYDAEHTDYTYARIDGGTSNPGYFTDKNATPSQNFAEYIWEVGVNNNWDGDREPLYCGDGRGTYVGFFYAQEADWSEGKGAFKFRGAPDNWDNGNYGTGTINQDGLSGTLINDNASGNIIAEPAFYRAEVNLANMTYQLTSISAIGIIGPAQSGGWNIDTDMTYNKETRAWEATVDLAADEFKFRANHAWDINWGGTADSLIANGDNLRIAEAGTYFIQFFPLCETKSYCIITKKSSAATTPEVAIWAGEFVCAGWEGNQDLAWGGFDWTTIAPGTKLRFYYKKNTAGAWGCISLRHGDSWGELPAPIPAQYDLYDDEGMLEVTFTQEVLADIIANDGLVITGDNYTLSKVTYPIDEDLKDDVYTIGETDFSTEFYTQFSKYYQIPQGGKWVSKFKLNLNPNDNRIYKNFVLLITNDEDRRAGQYKECGAFRYDAVADSTRTNSQWGTSYVFPFQYTTSTLYLEPDENEMDPNVQKLGGLVTLTVDRSQADAFVITMSNEQGVVKTYHQPYVLPNFNNDSTNSNIRCYITVENSQIEFKGSNIEPIGGYSAPVATVEPYAVLKGDTLLTFYYDDQKSVRGGIAFLDGTDVNWPSSITSVTQAFFDSSFAEFSPTSTANWFNGFTSLTTITGLEFLNTANVTNMGSMFRGCSSLKEFDLGSINTSQVRYMESMFNNCSSLTNLNLSSFNTSNVTSMFGMFAECKKLTELNLSSFETTNTTDMQVMFSSASQLKTIYVGSGWDVSNVRSSDYMFLGCTSLVGGAGTPYDADHVDASYAHIDGGSANPGYFTRSGDSPWVDPVIVAAPEFRFEGDNLTMTTETQNASIFYKVAELPSMAEAVVDSVKNSLIVTPDGQQSTYYEHPFELKMAAVVKAIAVADNATGTIVSDTTTMVYDYQAWVNLKAAVTSGVDLYSRAQGNPNVDTQLLEQLQWALNEGDMIYNNRAQMDSSEADQFATRIMELYTQIESQMNGTATQEAYVVLTGDSVSGMTATFFYDSLKDTHTTSVATVMVNDIRNSQTWFNNSEYIKSASFDASFASYYPTSTAYWFYPCNKLESIIGIEYLNTDNVTNMAVMFGNCASLTSIDLSRFKTDNVTDMSGMFTYCSKLTSIDLSNFNTQNVQSMNGMFGGCTGLENLNLSSFNTEKVTDMYAMFSNCRSLTSLDLSSFDTSNTIRMSGMFGTCGSLTNLDLSSFNTSNVTDMSNMFSGCGNLKTLDLSSFSTSKVTDMSGMFDSCWELTSVYVGNDWNTAAVTLGDNMFTNCMHIVGGSGTTYSADHEDYTYAHIDGGENNPGYFTDKNAPITVAAPEFRFEGDNLTMTTETQNAGIFYKVADLPSMDDAVVASVVNSLIVTADGQSTYYDQPFELKKAAVVKAIAIIRNEIATFVSDTTTMVYDYEAWVNLKSAVESGVDLYGRAQGNPNVDTQLLEQLQWALNEGDMIYNQRAQMDSFEAKHFTQRINELCAQIEAQIRHDGDVLVATVDGIAWTYKIISEVNKTCQIGEGERDKPAIADSISGIVSVPAELDGYTVTTIGAWALYDRKNLTGVNLPATVTNIGRYGMDRSISLLTISKNNPVLSDRNANIVVIDSTNTVIFGCNGSTIPEGIVAIGEDAFRECSFPSVPQLPTSLRSVGTRAFFNCSGMMGLILPEGLENIDTQGFGSCGLQSISFPSTLTSLGSAAFDDNNFTSVYIPATLTWISSSPFEHNSNLTEIIVDAANPNYDSRDNCNAIIRGTTLLQGCNTTIIPNGITRLGWSAFQGMKHGLKTLVIPEGVTDLGDYTFYSCEAMEEVTIPSTVVTIGAVTFEDCISLRDIYCYIQNPFDLDMTWSGPFGTNEYGDRIYENANLHVPYGTKALYEAREGWKKFQHIVEMDIATSFVDGVLTVGGSNTLAEALDQFASSNVTERAAAIIWQSSANLTNSELQRMVNPNLLIYVTDETKAPADRNNIIVDGFAKNIVLTDVAQGNNDFYCPQSFTAEAISYTREFKQKTQIGVSRGWETIALPFNVQTIMHETRGLITPFGNNRSNSHFWLRRLTHDGLQSDSIIEANTAYLISMPNSEEYIADYNLSGRVTFSAENATVPMTEVVKDESADYVMTPCFTNAAAKQGIYVLNVGEQRSGYPEGSIFESNYRAVLPFQAYVEHKGSNPAPPYFIVGDLGGDTTGIDATLVNSERVNSEAWYTLDGRKLQGKPTQKGVYITNGKKVIIK